MKMAENLGLVNLINDVTVILRADHYKSYEGGGRGIFEPQEFFFVIKFLV